ncbi:helix-turn-helix domain-containing protein [Paraburkholderia nodosa]|uniref:transcriptional regulator n=1 Tax=Paraburkholderia nodosa TaxID=392320 RepID=UPI00068482FD|nr:transcriptional regulator [Paraburkholderia nodosa]
MLTGKELGDAIAAAIKKKGVTKKAFADAMGVKPASVQDWVKFGRVAKTRIEPMIHYFSDVADLEYWGFDLIFTERVSDPWGGTKENSLRINPEVNPGSADVSGGLKSERNKLEEFISELREAFESGQLSPKRLSLMRDLLQDGVETHPPSYAQQQLKTRGVHGGARRPTARKKAG